jgi:hypothetical protein
MSLSSDLRLLATAVEAQRDTLERLDFCARAYLTALSVGDASDKQAKLEQLRDVLKLSAKMI